MRETRNKVLYQWLPWIMGKRQKHVQLRVGAQTDGQGERNGSEVTYRGILWTTEHVVRIDVSGSGHDRTFQVMIVTAVRRNWKWHWYASYNAMYDSFGRRGVNVWKYMYVSPRVVI